MFLKKIASIFRRPPTADLNQFRELFERFQQILKGNNRVFELISELEDKLSGEYIFDINYLIHVNDELSRTVHLIISNLNVIADNRYHNLYSRQATIQEELDNIIKGQTISGKHKYIIDCENIDADISHLVGGKSANMGEIKNHLKMLTPVGFVLSTAMYQRFMEENKLWPEIKRIHQKYAGDDRHSAEDYDHSIDKLFNSARVPADLAKSVNRGLAAIHKNYEGEIKLAVRSSAFGEDTLGRSFAGQFKSFLCSNEEDILENYVKIIASRFKYGVTAYSGERAFKESELPMAVCVQKMVEAEVSGVAYSLDPSGEFSDSLAISACYGLGTGTVEGLIDTDYFRVSRIDPSQIYARRIGRKQNQVVPAEVKGTKTIPVKVELSEKACLSDAQIIDLAEHVLMLDRYFKRPVDVEWCFDKKGGLYILQCRPLKITPKPMQKSKKSRKALADIPVLMRKRGQVAQRGIAAGKIRQVHDDDNISDFPVGAIAVTKYTTPRLTSLIRRASAIITDIGSPSGHMATVAREFGVPMIVGTADATHLLEEGTMVTVDAEDNTIYRGFVKELLEYEAEGEDVFRDLREYRILRHILRRIWPLYLLDPASPDFTAKNCRTYHDIVRFSHEKAVQILINLNMSSQRFRGVKTRKLKLPIPLGLYVIDLGEGLSDDVSSKEVSSLDQVKSKPMLAILQGLVSPGAWGTQAVQLGFGDLVSSLTRFSITDRANKYHGQNLAVISSHYANISLRLGYHFNVIDTYVSENVDDNYIYFRFAGGVTGTERRHLRATLIKDILEKLNFKVALSGDLVVGRLKKWHEDEVLQILNEIGRLIGFTRQLDTQMQSEQSVSEWFRIFFDREKGSP